MAMKYKLLFLGTMALLIVACGESSSSSSNANNSDNTDKADNADKIDNEEPDSIVVQNMTISGRAQKGPFLKGGSVTVWELDSETFTQTGKSFKGKIFNDKGEYVVSGVTFASRYALLEANGYYWNENTFKESKGTVALKALVDLFERKNININLLTHLAYERVLYLTATGIDLEVAKKQAEKEIFEAFGIAGDFARAEDLDIFASGDGNAALLAISVLLPSDLADVNLAERLANFADDIECDGKWDDKVAKAAIADWASAANLEAIVSNVMTMSDSGNMPYFEAIVKDFWWNNYRLRTCAAANPGEIKQDANSLSRYSGDYFICDSAIANWRRATTMEYDTYQWTAGKDGTVKKGAVTAAKYKYDELQCRWLNATTNDGTLGLKGCTQKREAEVGKGRDDTYYICRSGEWQQATRIEYNTYQKKCSDDAALISGAVYEGDKYVCDADTFRFATEDEKINRRGCTSYNLGEERLVGGYMECSSSGVWTVGRTVPGTMIDNRDDNRQYATIGIGTQTWMAENLDYDYKVNGTSYGSYCYNNSADSCAKYGRLYTWAAAMDSAATGCGYETNCAVSGLIQGACPNGWHLPSSAEWETLFGAVVGVPIVSTRVGNALIAGSGTFGFSALPSGRRGNDGTYSRGYEFWTSSISDESNAYMLFLYKNYSSGRCHSEKDFSYAVRCVKDAN